MVAESVEWVAAYSERLGHPPELTSAIRNSGTFEKASDILNLANSTKKYTTITLQEDGTTTIYFLDKKWSPSGFCSIGNSHLRKALENYCRDTVMEKGHFRK